MTRPHFLNLVALSLVCLLTPCAEFWCSAGSLAPLQTLNFDFGGGEGYVGDDGVISSPGGTYWNAVSADDLTELWNVGTDILDEFGQPTPAILFTAYPSAWANSSSPVYEGPHSDGIRPSTSGAPLLSVGRVHIFKEMIIYLNGPVGDLRPPFNYGGGFTPGIYIPEVVQPFPYTFGIGGFPGREGFSYLRITTRPPLAGGLGEAKTLTIVLEDSRSIIAAIQIRGRFQGAPEPSGIVLIALGSSAALLRRVPLLPQVA